MNNIELEKKTKNIVHSLVYEKGLVCAVDVLLRLEYLSKKDYEDWRFGRIPYLEKCCQINLKKLSIINKVIKRTAADLKLESSWTGYNKHGKGPKQRLIFSKSGNKNIEYAYATHYLDKKRMAEIKLKKSGIPQVEEN